MPDSNSQNLHDVAAAVGHTWTCGTCQTPNPANKNTCSGCGSW